MPGDAITQARPQSRIVLTRLPLDGLLLPSDVNAKVGPDVQKIAEPRAKAPPLAWDGFVLSPPRRPCRICRPRRRRSSSRASEPSQSLVFSPPAAKHRRSPGVKKARRRCAGPFCVEGLCQSAEAALRRRALTTAPAKPSISSKLRETVVETSGTAGALTMSVMGAVLRVMSLPRPARKSAAVRP